MSYEFNQKDMNAIKAVPMVFKVYNALENICVISTLKKRHAII